jgi:hypothetical protein
MNVIENERQLKITRRWRRRFKEGARKVEDHPDIHPILKDVQIQAMLAQVNDFYYQISKYIKSKNARERIKRKYLL